MNKLLKKTEATSSYRSLQCLLYAVGRCLKQTVKMGHYKEFSQQLIDAVQTSQKETGKSKP